MAVPRRKRTKKPLAMPARQRGRPPGAAAVSAAAAASTAPLALAAAGSSALPYQPVSSTSPGTATGIGKTDMLATVQRTHPRYDDWVSKWVELGHLYEGTGPYANGEALIPHIRELLYKVSLGADGAKIVDFTQVVGQKIKFQQRKALARYENFAATIVDTLTDHQYAKDITREAEKGDGQALLDKAPIAGWWEDVDGYGCSMDDFLKNYQVLANVFGHLFVVMDRLQTNPNRRTYNVSPAGQKTSITTLADQGQPVLRVYTPIDALDWLAPFNRLTAIKFAEPVERTSLMEAPQPDLRQYILWDSRSWTRFSMQGQQEASGFHNLGELPVTIWYARRRGHVPIIGRSDLRNPELYRDHYNLISELREIFRSQTFSMMHIQLEKDQTIDQARALLGDHAGTDSLVFTKGGASFIAPPDGPATTLTNEIANLERKIFRLVGLPWQSDTKSVESADALGIKAADLDRSLASHADYSEAVDYNIARQWFNSMYGPDRGPVAYDSAGLTIRHPDDFNIEEVVAAAGEAKSVIDIGVGPTATKLIKGRLVPLILPDLGQKERDTITTEIDTMTTEEHANKQAQAKAAADGAVAAAKQVATGAGAGAGAGPNPALSKGMSY